MAIFFHLFMLGMICLVSSISLKVQPLSRSAVLQPTVQEVILRVGVLLVVVGVGYYLALRVASRIRENEQARQISADTEATLGQRGVLSPEWSRGRAARTGAPAKPEARQGRAARFGLLGRRFR